MVLLMLILFIVVDVFFPVASAAVVSLLFLASVRSTCDANAYAHILFNFLLVIFIDSYLLIEKESERVQQQHPAIVAAAIAVDTISRQRFI